eukprot:TRINITY_DN4847_c0_g3_i1.p2 TRINITY_DN4847_c0_g3~~TRINITY_DN4847_c0_g3_i1.p2  ORF type:complete len:188 (-),score=44.48 TRINITY_DN4847_c0_g3_i1:547-1110(-)
MAQQGATLQNNNNELVKCIEALKGKHVELEAEIAAEEHEKAIIQTDIQTLNKRLGQLHAAATQRRAVLEEYDRCIRESEGTYSKIVGMAETLLQFAKREAGSLRAKEAMLSLSSAAGGGLQGSSASSHHHHHPPSVMGTTSRAVVVPGVANGSATPRDAHNKWETPAHLRVRGTTSSKATPILDHGL